MRAYRPLVLLTAALLLSGVTACRKNQSIVQVGERRLSEDMLGKRAEQMQIVRPKFSRAHAARGIIEGWAAAAVLEKYGEPISREQLSAERDRLKADKKTKDLYVRVQQIYGPTGDAFLETALLPDMALQKLHGVYDRTGVARDDARYRAEQFLKQIDAGKVAFADAVSSGARITAFAMSADGKAAGAVPAVFSANENEQAAALERLAPLAQGAGENAVLRAVFTVHDGAAIVRHRATEKGIVQLDAAVFPEIQFSDWLAREAAALRVCINDERVRFDYEQAAPPISLNCD